MKRNILIASCCVLMIFILAGCRLAKEYAGTDANGDKLIGVFVTTEYLDLFDLDGFLSGNFNGFQGSGINMNGNATQKYQGRFYAAFVPRTYTNEETGETTVIHEYAFEGISGISYCAPVVNEDETGHVYTSTMYDPAVSDGHTYLNIGDDERSISLEGIIYVTPTKEMVTYYFNPVYQSADGSVYAVTGDGFMVSTEIFGEGDVFSQTISAVTTTTENGKTKKDSASVTVSIKTMYTPEKIVIVQMDSDSKLLSRTEYMPGATPDEYMLEKGAAYFIVETHKRDNAGDKVISREIYGKEVDNITTYYAREDGICIKSWTQINKGM